MGDRETFPMVSKKGVTNDAVCINGRFVYTIKHKPRKTGNTKTEAYIDNQRRLDARLRKMPPRSHRYKRLTPNIAVTKFKSLSMSHIV